LVAGTRAFDLPCEPKVTCNSDSDFDPDVGLGSNLSNS
jgi:hypothetical protein